VELKVLGALVLASPVALSFRQIHASIKFRSVIVYFLQRFGTNNLSVRSPTVRIIAFQAIDPGSTPGGRMSAVVLRLYVASKVLE
jgi:hypothetical protein